MQHESYVFDPRPQYPLVVAVKRYWHPEFCSQDADALTLICTHGTGFHKEQWEPTLQHLYDAVKRAGSITTGSPPKIHEIWSLDCPNHGDAAIINEEELSWGYSEVFGWTEYARSIHAFLKDQGTGIPADFSTRRLVGVGHSMGAISLALATTFTPTVNFSAILMVEPMLLPPPNIKPEQDDLPQGARKRRDIWPSRAAALDILQSRPSFQAWDPRVLKIFAEHGLRDLPTSTYPDQTEGVTLKCTKAQEEACYNDKLGRSRAFKYLPVLCARMPVHFIYGALNEVFSTEETKSYVLNDAAQGKYASVSRVAGAGHLVVQMQPENLADAIYAALVQEAARGQSSDWTIASRL